MRSCSFFSFSFLPAVFILFLLSCGDSAEKTAQDSTAKKTPLPEMQRVTMRGYSLLVPKTSKPTNTLSAEAALQYEDRDSAREFYVIVLDEPKDSTIALFKQAGMWDEQKSPAENYGAFQLLALKERVEIAGEPVVVKETINGMDAQVVSFPAKPGFIPAAIYYKFAFYEGTDRFYYLSVWTLDSYKAKHEAEMDAVVRSFRLDK